MDDTTEWEEFGIEKGPTNMGHMSISSFAEHQSNEEHLILSQNARSVRANNRNLKNLVSELRPTILCIQETWGHDLIMPGYKSVSNHRKSRGGGISILFNTSLCRLTPDVNIMNDSIELTCAMNKQFIITNVYRPPKGDIKLFLDTLKEHLQYTTDKNIPHYMMGDFNINILNENCRYANQLVDICLDYSMTSSIKAATRINNTNGTMIDAIFGKESTIKKRGILLTDISDHLTVLVTIPKNKPKQRIIKNITYRKVSEENILAARENLAKINWSILEASDTNAAYNMFINIFTDIYNKHCPIVTRRFNPKYDKYHKHMTDGLLTSKR